MEMSKEEILAGFLELPQSEQRICFERLSATMMRRVGKCIRKAGTKQNEMDEYINAIRRVTGKDVTIRSREEDLVSCRYIICWWATLMGHTQSQIGQALKLDHSTVAYGINRMADTLEFPQGNRRRYELYNAFIREVTGNGFQD